MRKQTKWAVVLGAAAVMTFGACMTSFAATGWVEEDGEWYWYDNNGDSVENEWKKASDGKYYYLGDDGAMVVDALIDDEYYVNESGVRITNEWRKLTSISDDSEEAWFYFGSNGKSYKEGVKTINGKKYAFSDDGEMETGWWQDPKKAESENWYYHGEEDDGARYAAVWAYLEDEDEDEEGWYYFNTNGSRVQKDSSKNEAAKKKVNNKTYYFGADGKMLYGWVALAEATSETDWAIASDNNMVYLGEEDDGAARISTWEKIVQPDNANEEEKWYYFGKDGNPYVGNGSAKGSIEKINNKYYAFDTNGKMLTGVKTLKLDQDQVKDSEGNITVGVEDNGDVYAIYYFGGSNDGAMKTGKNTVSDDYDENYVAYFKSDGTIEKGRGAGITATKSGVLYVAGIRVEADEDTKYGAYYVDGEGYLLISESGKIQTKKSSGVKNGNDVTIKTNDKGYIINYKEADNKNWANNTDGVLGSLTGTRIDEIDEFDAINHSW